jgi:hypothetical protein
MPNDFFEMGKTHGLEWSQGVRKSGGLGGSVVVGVLKAGWQHLMLQWWSEGIE